MPLTTTEPSRYETIDEIRREVRRRWVELRSRGKIGGYATLTLAAKGRHTSFETTKPAASKATFHSFMRGALPPALKDGGLEAYLLVLGLAAPEIAQIQRVITEELAALEGDQVRELRRVVGGSTYNEALGALLAANDSVLAATGPLDDGAGPSVPPLPIQFLYGPDPGERNRTIKPRSRWGMNDYLDELRDQIWPLEQRMLTELIGVSADAMIPLVCAHLERIYTFYWAFMVDNVPFSDGSLSSRRHMIKGTIDAELQRAFVENAKACAAQMVSPLDRFARHVVLRAHGEAPAEPPDEDDLGYLAVLEEVSLDLQSIVFKHLYGISQGTMGFGASFAAHYQVRRRRPKDKLSPTEKELLECYESLVALHQKATKDANALIQGNASYREVEQVYADQYKAARPHFQRVFELDHKRRLVPAAAAALSQRLLQTGQMEPEHYAAFQKWLQGYLLGTA